MPTKTILVNDGKFRLLALLRQLQDSMDGYSFIHNFLLLDKKIKIAFWTGGIQWIPGMILCYYYIDMK